MATSIPAIAKDHRYSATYSSTTNGLTAGGSGRGSAAYSVTQDGWDVRSTPFEGSGFLQRRDRSVNEAFMFGGFNKQAAGFGSAGFEAARSGGKVRAPDFGDRFAKGNGKRTGTEAINAARTAGYRGGSNNSGLGATNLAHIDSLVNFGATSNLSPKSNSRSTVSFNAGSSFGKVSQSSSQQSFSGGGSSHRHDREHVAMAGDNFSTRSNSLDPTMKAEMDRRIYGSAFKERMTSASMMERTHARTNAFDTSDSKTTPNNAQMPSVFSPQKRTPYRINWGK